MIATTLAPTRGLTADDFPKSADVITVQRTVFQATRNRPRPLTGLMTWVLDRRNLAAAFERVSGTDGADTPGPDGVTCSHLKHRVGPWLADLADALYHRTYSPAAPAGWTSRSPISPATPVASAS